MSSGENNIQVFTQTSYDEGSVVYDGSKLHPRDGEIDPGLNQAYHDGLRLAYDAGRGEVIFYDNLHPSNANVQALTRVTGDELPLHDAIDNVEEALDELNRNGITEVDKHDIVDDIRRVRSESGIADTTDIQNYDFEDIRSSYLSDDDFDYEKWPEGVDTPEDAVADTLAQIEENGQANLTAADNFQAFRYLLAVSSEMPSVVRSGAVTEGGLLKDIDGPNGGHRDYDIVVNSGVLRGIDDDGIEPSWFENTNEDQPDSSEDNDDNRGFLGGLLD